MEAVVSFSLVIHLRCFWASASASEVVNSQELNVPCVDCAVSSDKMALSGPNNDPFSTVSWYENIRPIWKYSEACYHIMVFCSGWRQTYYRPLAQYQSKLWTPLCGYFLLHISKFILWACTKSHTLMDKQYSCCVLFGSCNYYSQSYWIACWDGI